MVRLDYILICRDELEAKILRIIEMYIEDVRNKLYLEHLNKLPKGSPLPEQQIEITRDVRVSISHRTFMYDLYGLVKSENTLKKAIKSLIDKGFIQMHYDAKKKYEAPQYQIVTETVQEEFDKITQLGVSGYQKLIPSNSDTIKNGYHQNLPPRGDQELTPSGTSRVSEFDTNSRSNYEKSNTVEEDVNADALTRTPSQENENAYPQENTSSQHQQASTVDNSQQANKDVLIATSKPQGSVSVDTPIRNTDSLFSDVPSAPDTPQQNGHRKPRTPKVDPDLQKRIEAVLVALDECAREVMGDADFAYRRTKVATEEVTSLLKERRVTREDLHAVYLKMWNTPPDPRTGFDWKKNMTVKAFCNNFDRMLIEIKGNAKQNGTGNTTPKQETTSVLGVSGQRHYEFEPLPFRKAR